MNIAELHNKLITNGIPAERYYLQGAYGSSDDNEKYSMVIRRGKYYIEYETYYKERGEKSSIFTFTNEDEACNYFYKWINASWIFEKIQGIEGLRAMTVNERLYHIGMFDEFASIKKNDKERARKILQWLLVDKPSIDLILK